MNKAPLNPKKGENSSIFQYFLDEKAYWNALSIPAHFPVPDFAQVLTPLWHKHCHLSIGNAVSLQSLSPAQGGMTHRRERGERRERKKEEEEAGDMGIVEMWR